MLRRLGLKFVKETLAHVRCGLSYRADPWLQAQRQGLLWRLCMDRYVDRQIAQHGMFEPSTTSLVRALLMPGMQVLDVGANIGYFSLICAQQVGSSGKVWAFEPVSGFRERLLWHIGANGFQERVCVARYGLSDAVKSLPISLGDSSATLHWALPSPPSFIETIQVRPFDQVWQELGCDDVNFAKVDIDGHEPFFLRGAQSFFQHCKPIMVLEFSQLNLRKAGEDVSLLRLMIEQLAYTLYSERTLNPFTDEEEFLLECGSMDRSANVWAIPNSAVTVHAPLDDLLRLIASKFLRLRT
jgi:FkbM family methyltransferase